MLGITISIAPQLGSHKLVCLVPFVAFPWIQLNFSPAERLPASGARLACMELPDSDDTSADDYGQERHEFHGEIIRPPCSYEQRLTEMNKLSAKQRRKRLPDACTQHDIALMRAIFDAGGVDVNTTFKSYYGKTVLHWAVQDYEMLKALVQEYKVKIDIRDSLGRTPLHAACSFGARLSCVRYLVEHGANVHAKDMLKETPLLTAAHTDHVDVIQYLLNQGADIFATGSGKSNILHACVGSVRPSPAVVRLILNSGGVELINSPDWAERTPIFFVENSQVAELLIRTGADLNFRTVAYDPLLVFVTRKNYWRKPEAVIPIFLEAGIDVNMGNPRTGITALHNAVDKVDLALVENLLKFGANPLAPANRSGVKSMGVSKRALKLCSVWTPLHLVILNSVQELFTKFIALPSIRDAIRAPPPKGELSFVDFAVRCNPQGPITTALRDIQTGGNPQ